MWLNACTDSDLNEIGKLLLDSDVNYCDSHGKTILIYASEHGLYPVVNYLISRDVDVNKANNSGKTALMYACPIDNLDIITMLLSANANFAAEDDQGQNAFIYAA